MAIFLCVCVLLCVCFFFFKQKTAYEIKECDWSSECALPISRPMREEAASAGMFESPWGTHPRLQLLTVEELLEGKRIDCPPLGQLSKAFKKAPKAEDPSKQLSLGAESEE